MEALREEDPHRIGEYRLLGRLGAGGMGQVYLARSRGGRTVAVKLVREELAREPEFRRRFRHEVEAARRVGGEWTAPVLDADTDAETPWVATGYIAGPSLQTVVDEDYGPLPEHTVYALAAGLVEALRAIHGAGLVHRDLKPSNVLVTIDGPKVIDFGIARALETAVDGGQTRTGAVIGSPGFMSPEQVRGERVGPAGDVFCLGSVLAFAATGHSPFGTVDSGQHALMFRIAEEAPDLSGLDDGLRDLVAGCLAKDPADRPTVAELLERTAESAAHADEDGRPWLPGVLVARLGRHAARLLDTEGPDADATKVREPGDAVAEPGPEPAVPPRPVVPPMPAVPAPPARAPEVGAEEARDAEAAPVPPPAPSVPPAPVDPPAPPAPAPVAAPAVPAPTPAPPPPPYARPDAVPPPHVAPAGPNTPVTVGFGVPPTMGGPPPAGRPRRGRRWPVVAAIALAICLLAGSGAFAFRFLQERDKGNEAGKTTPSASANPSEDTSADGAGTSDDASDTSDGSDAAGGDGGDGERQTLEGALPEEYLGIWEGKVENRNGEDEGVHRRFEIRQGMVGGVVATTYSLSGKALCEGAAKLVSFDNLMVVTSEVARSVPEGDCSASKEQTLKLRADGALVWSYPDRGHRAVLTRVEADEEPVPTEYLGEWEGTDGKGQHHRVTVKQAPIGDVALKWVGASDSLHCEWDGTLVSVREGELLVGPSEVTHSEPAGRCKDGDLPSLTLRLADEGEELRVVELGTGSSRKELVLEPVEP